MKKTPVRLAMVGCGAVMEVCHLPAARLARDALDPVALCDPDLERARALAKRFSIGRCVAERPIRCSGLLGRRCRGRLSPEL